MQRLCRNALAKGTAWFGICSQILESYWATQEKHKSHTSTGKKRALVDGLSHDLGTVPDRFTMSILRGRCGTVNYHHQFLNSIWTKKHIPGAKWPESWWQTVRRLNKHRFVRPVYSQCFTCRLSCLDVWCHCHAGTGWKHPGFGLNFLPLFEEKRSFCPCPENRFWLNHEGKVNVPLLVYPCESFQNLFDDECVSHCSGPMLFGWLWSRWQRLAMGISHQNPQLDMWWCPSSLA